MNLQTFAYTSKETNLKFYFKPQNNRDGELYLLVEPYKQKLKPFKMIKREDGEIDGMENREWEIFSDSEIPKEIKELEIDFSDLIQEKLGFAH